MVFVKAEMSQVWKSVVSPEEIADGIAFCSVGVDKVRGILSLRKVPSQATIGGAPVVSDDVVFISRGPHRTQTLTVNENKHERSI